MHLCHQVFCDMPPTQAGIIPVRGSQYQNNSDTDFNACCQGHQKRLSQGVTLAADLCSHCKFSSCRNNKTNKQNKSKGSIADKWCKKIAIQMLLN